MFSTAGELGICINILNVPTRCQARENRKVQWVKEGDWVGPQNAVGLDFKQVDQARGPPEGGVILLISRSVGCCLSFCILTVLHGSLFPFF
jgi:hypothetical protein